jgi:AcrR family transcriptional regulator
MEREEDFNTMKRELKRERTRRLLLDTAKALIQEKGCAGMTLNDIMERSGLSKGGIYHYVKSKDELLGWVLQEWLEETSRRFFAATAYEPKTFERPMKEIVASLPDLENPGSVGNQVFMYLLGKCHQPEVQEVMRQFYEGALQVSKQWIAAGQKAGFIPRSVDAGKTAELFVLISLGLRVRSFISSGDYAFASAEFAKLMAEMLRPSNHQSG